MHLNAPRGGRETLADSTRCRCYNVAPQRMSIIPESHLASIGEITSAHDGVLGNGWF